jgi:nicotinamidase-related amidase
VDVQRWFTEPEHPFAQVVEKLVPGATDGNFDRVTSTVLPNIQRLQQAFRSLGRPVILTCVTPQINALGLAFAHRKRSATFKGPTAWVARPPWATLSPDVF